MAAIKTLTIVHANALKQFSAKIYILMKLIIMIVGNKGFVDHSLEVST